MAIPDTHNGFAILSYVSRIRMTVLWFCMEKASTVMDAYGENGRRDGDGRPDTRSGQSSPDRPDGPEAVPPAVSGGIVFSVRKIDKPGFAGG